MYRLNKNQILVFIISFLIAGFFLLSIPEAGFSGNGGSVCCDDNILDDFPVCAIDAIDCTDNLQGNVCESGIMCILEARCECPPPTGACCFPFRGGIRCDIHTEADCLGLAGVWQGPDTNCGEVTCPPPIPIPTLNQWGMIIMAGVLGLFAVIALFVMRRRHEVKPIS